MLKKKNLLFIVLLVFVGQAKSNDKIENSVVIEGDKQALELSDLPLSQYQYDDLSFFTQNIHPEKELIGLLDKPEVLMGLENKDTALDFDEPIQSTSER